jgi:ribosome-associated protein
MQTPTPASVERPGFIKLDQFLKFQNLVQSGGEAKMLIQEGAVKVNGQVDTRRGRKLVTGDQVELGGQVLVVDLDEESSSDSGPGSSAWT